MKFFIAISAVLLVGFSMPWFSGSPGPDLSDVVVRPATEAAPTAPAGAKKLLAVDWPTLRALDSRTGTKSSTIAQLVSDGVIVRVPGFMIPLEDRADAVTECLFIPYPLACVHVPPPPPNLMIHVQMAGTKKQKVFWGEPIWVQGRLQVVETASPYGAAASTMTGMLVEPYQP
jgi:uncharacterized protein